MSLFGGYEATLAWRYLRSRRKDGFIALTTWFAMVGIALGVATLILVTSLMNGIREEMVSSFIGIDGHVTVYGEARSLIDYRNATSSISKVEGVQLAVPRVEGQVMASNQGRALGAQVVAFPAEDLPKKNLLWKHLAPQAQQAVQNGEGLVLGEQLARNLGIRVGQQVTLISPEGRATFAGFVPRIKAYPVVGTVKLGMHLYDSSLILMPFEEAQIFFRHKEGEGEGGVSAIEVSVANPDNAAEVGEAIAQQFQGRARVIDWQTANRSVFQALLVQRNVMVIILALIVVVAAFNIISSLIMLVKDKGQAVAILRTVGATRRSVMRIFILAGLGIGVAGTLVGIVLGLLAAANLDAIRQFIEKISGQPLLVENIYFLSTLPTRTEPMQVVVIVLVALALSFLATLYPAWRAASISPAEALRYG